MTKLTRVTAAVAGVLALAACEQATNVTEPNVDGPAFIASPPPGGTARTVIVCKEAPSGEFDFTVTNPNSVDITVTSPLALNDEECATGATTTGASDSVTVTELDEPGFDFDSVRVWSHNGHTNVTSLNRTEFDPVVRAAPFGPDRGWILVYYNSPEPPPGDEGCTPGYWKQDQHLDSWVPTGFSPNQTLQSVFDVPDAFGLDNFTLLQALSFDGGPSTTSAARLLLKHAVAAILNAAHPDVNSPNTVAGIIADVNAALATGDRDTMLDLKDELVADNQLGCPLN